MFGVFGVDIAIALQLFGLAFPLDCTDILCSQPNWTELN